MDPNYGLLEGVAVHFGEQGGNMNRFIYGGWILVCGIFLLAVSSIPAWAQAQGHASVGLGHGEEGYLHLEEMIKHLEYSLGMPDASPDLKKHGAVALQHAREALKHYNEAIQHASEALGRRAGGRMMEGSGEGSGEGSMEGSGEGSRQERGPGPMGEGSGY